MTNRTPTTPAHSVIVETIQVQTIKLVRFLLIICVIFLTCWGIFLAGKGIVLSAHYAQLKSAMADHKWDDAFVSLGKIQKINPLYKDIESMDREIYYEATVQYIENKDWQNAQGSINLLLSLDSGYKNALELKHLTWYEPALHHFNAGKYNESRTEIAELLAYDIDYQEGIFLLFKTYQVEIDQAIKSKNEGLLDKLSKEFLEGASEYSDRPEYKKLIETISNAYQSFALNSYNAENYSVSRSQIEKVLNFDSKNHEAISLFFKCYQNELNSATKTKDVKKIDSLAKEIAINKDRFSIEPAFKSLMESLVHSYYLIADDEVKNNQLDNAISNLEKILDIDPDYRDCDEKLASLVYARDMNQWVHGETNPSCEVIKGHTDIIRAVKFSQDGKWFATASKDETAKIWNTSNWSTEKTLSDHSEYVFALDFSPDAKILATGSFDLTVRMWNVQTGKLLHTLHGHDREVVSVAFSPDGAMLASGGMDKTIFLWNVAKGSKIAKITEAEGDIYGLSFSPDGTILASSCEDKVIRLWNVHTKRLIGSFEINSVSKDIQFSNSGTKLAITNPGEDFILLVDVEKMKMDRINIPSPVRILDWSVDDRYLIASNSSVYFIDMKSRSVVNSLDLKSYFGKSSLSSMDFSNNADFLGIGLDNGSFLICNYD